MSHLYNEDCLNVTTLEVTEAVNSVFKCSSDEQSGLRRKLLREAIFCLVGSTAEVFISPPFRSNKSNAE